MQRVMQAVAGKKTNRVDSRLRYSQGCVLRQLHVWPHPNRASLDLLFPWSLTLLPSRQSRMQVPQRMTPPPSSPQRCQEVPPMPATNAEATASVTETRSQVLSRKASTLTDLSAADEQPVEKENVPEPTKKATAKKGKKNDNESQPTRRAKNKKKSK